MRFRCIALVTGFSILAMHLFVSCTKEGKSHDAGDNKDSITLLYPLPSALHESSGLCYTDGRLWSFGDSGNPPYLYCIDTATGAILQTVRIQNFSNEDWEDITADDQYIYVGDFGNNDGNRKDLRVLRISKQNINTGAADVAVQAEAIYFSFADQTVFPVNKHSDFNCEAIASVGDELYIFTKDESDFRTRCYPLSKTPGTYAVLPISSFNSEGEITSAAYNPSTNELALGGYQSGKLHPFIWFFTDFAGDDFFEGKKNKILLSKDDKAWQTEGLAYISSQQLFLSCESTSDVAASLYKINRP